MEYSIFGFTDVVMPNITYLMPLKRTLHRNKEVKEKLETNEHLIENEAQNTSK
jgi:hypothetical protein